MEKNAVGLKKSVLKFGETRHCSQVTFRLASVFHCRMLPGFFTIGSCCGSRLTNFYDLDPLYAHRKERRMYARLSNPRGNKSLFDIEEIRTLKHTHQDFRNNVKPVFDSISNVFVTNISTWTHESKHQHQCFAELSGFIRAGTVTCLVFRRAVTFFFQCGCCFATHWRFDASVFSRAHTHYQKRYRIGFSCCYSTAEWCWIYVSFCGFFVCVVFLCIFGAGPWATGPLGTWVWKCECFGNLEASTHHLLFLERSSPSFFFLANEQKKKRWLHSGRVQTHGASLEANVQYLDMRARQMG